MSYTFRQWQIPDRMLAGLDRYLVHGIMPGDFLRLILVNDFVRAAGRADDENLANLPAYACWVYNECPSDAWGSAEKVAAWIESRNSKRDVYLKLLHWHDWSYEFSDDHRIYTAGNEARKTLRAMQPDVDPDYKLWNSVAPEEFQIAAAQS